MELVENKYKCKKGHLIESVAIPDKCIKCLHNMAIFRYRNTEYGFIQTMLKDLKKVDKIKNYTNLLSYDWFIERLKKQNAKCYYTGIEMNLIPKHKYKVSVDRIDNSIGHSPDNCVICINAVNSMKHVMNHDEFLLYNNKLLGIYVKNKYRIYSELKEREKKSITNMLSKMRNPCKRTQRSAFVYNITHDEFMKIREKTHDCCAITGIQGSWLPHKWNTLSIDRIDSTKPYNLENCQLLLKNINYLKGDFDFTISEIKDIIRSIANLPLLYQDIEPFDHFMYIKQKNGSIVYESDIDSIDKHMVVRCSNDNKFYTNNITLSENIWCGCSKCKKIEH